MNLEWLKDRKILAIAALVALFTVISLFLRIIPADGLFAANGANLLGNDPWYHMRQTEVLLSDYFQYPWFDPMTNYPSGTSNYWGPLFSIMGAGMAAIAGATTRTDIMYVASWLPALLGAGLVPVMYFAGEKIGDYKTGLIAALFAVFVSGQFFYRSLFGFYDHHVAEVFFNALFCLGVIIYLVYSRKHTVDLKDKESLKIPALIALGTGFAYFLGLATMTTMLIFGFVVAVYTFLQFIYDHFKGRSSEYLLFFNVVTFAFVAVLYFLLIGIQYGGFGISTYSMGQIVVYLGMIAFSVILYLISRFLMESKKPVYYYPAVLMGLIFAGLIVLAVAMPDLYNSLISVFWRMFGYHSLTLTIQEAKPWSFDEAWNSFNYGLIMFILAFFVMLYKYIREHRPEMLFVIIWSLVVFYITVIQVRFEYYLAVNIALLSAVFVSWALDFGIKDILLLGGIDLKTVSSAPSDEVKDSEKSKKKSNKKQSAKKPEVCGVNALVALLGIVLAVLFVYSSAAVDLATANGLKGAGMTPDWQESLEWMGENTPETGIDYYKKYDRDTYQAPEESYGVMSWWDYGHWITFTAKRPPNSNPFQQGVAGPNGAAAYFIQQDEYESNAILDHLNTRYIITDAEMDTAKFWAMATWYNSSLMQTPYQTDMGQIDKNGVVSSARLNNENYYLTMISKLHNFDGSLREPDMVYYVEYVDGTRYGSPVPVIAAAEPLSYPEAKAKADAFNLNAASGTAAGLFNVDILSPVCEVPALHNYRLIHESPTNVAGDGSDVRYVKTFEYVSGAHIKGEGTIALDLVTDQGREFTYRQKSTDGEFVVPYSTASDNYGTKAVGEYRIEGTDKTFSVSEDAVLDGLYIN